jgi:hypothetical protein
MNVRELIEKLQELDPSLDVMLPSTSDGLNHYLESVESVIKRDPFDGDWDSHVVQLS